MSNKVQGRVQVLIAPHAAAMNLEIVAVELRKQDARRYLRIFVARQDGQIMDWETCEQFHRSIVELLEEVEYDYLEVSSPGDRPLKTLRDFQRNIGREVDVKLYAAYEGKKQFTGILKAHDEQTMVLQWNDKELQLVNKSVAQVKPAFRIE